MGVVFHFYDSEEGESDEEEVVNVRGAVSRRTVSSKPSKPTQEQRLVCLLSFFFLIFFFMMTKK